MTAPSDLTTTAQLEAIRVVALGEVCKFKYGKGLAAKDRTGSGHPVYGSNGVVGFHDAVLTDGPAIVVGRKGSYGEVNFAPEPCWPIDTTYFIDGTCTDLNLEWLKHLLPTLGLNTMNRAAAVPGLNREDAYRVPIAVPEWGEQRRIAAILDKVDELRTKRRQAIAQLDTLIQSIFHSMFGDPDPEMDGRPLRTLISHGDRINYGVVQPGGDITGGKPLIRVGDLVMGRVRLTQLKTIAPEIEAQYKRSRLKGTEILVSCVGTIGEVVTAGPDVVGFNIARAVARVPIDRPSLRIYIAEYLRTARVRRYFTKELRTVSQPTLNIKQLGDALVIVPEEDQQVLFARRVSAVERLKDRHRAQLVELDALFASLQHRAFKGSGL